MKKAVMDCGINQNKIFVLPSGIDTKTIQIQSNNVNKIKGIGIISTRSINKFYKLDVLLDAFKRIDQKDLFLTFVGEGSELYSLKKNALSFGIADKVKFVGYIDNSSIGKILGKNHIYISLAPSDGVSASLLEAMAAGLIPIVYDNEANRYWIKNNKNGIMLNNIHPEYIAEKVNKAISMLNHITQIADYNYNLVKKKADLYKNSKKYAKLFSTLSK
jgi:glycosyltransferase involved in cell wall biosynthesis